MPTTSCAEINDTNLSFHRSDFKKYSVKEREFDQLNENLTTGYYPYIFKIIPGGSINVNEVKNNLSIKYKSPFYKHIVDLIFKGLSFPNDWIEEGISPPNIDAKTITKKICLNLHDSYGLIPIKIAPSKEEGVFVYYKHFNNDRTLLVEVYNNLEVAALVNDEANKNIVYSEDIKTLNFINVIEKLIEE